MSILARLQNAGLTLPDPPKPGGAYSPTILSGNLLFISAQFPIVSGELRYQGRLGDDLSTEDGYQAARLAALNVLSQINAALGGFDRLRQIVRLEGHFRTTPEFREHARVLDGASHLFHEILAEKAGHVRALYGHTSLPLDLSVELVVVAEVD